MSNAGPVLIRIPDQITKAVAAPKPEQRRRFGRLRTALFVIGFCCLGWYLYSLADTYVYQAYENWVFDQQIAGRSGASFSDYLREQTPFGFVAGRPEPTQQPAPAESDVEGPHPTNGTLLGRVEVPRLGISAIVREGADNQVLSRAVGHVPSTALPGENGNFAIAAHRDTLFRALKGIRIGDAVTFESADGIYSYRVFSTRIVRPTEVSVLRPDGGLPAIEGQLVNTSSQPQQLLTMITCYPFYYVGSAPKRFIVQARLVGTSGPRTRHKRL